MDHVEIVWENPPPRKRRQSDESGYYDALAQQLRENKGRWAYLGIHRRGRGSTLRRSLNSREGNFETSLRIADTEQEYSSSNDCHLYARCTATTWHPDRPEGP